MGILDKLTKKQEDTKSKVEKNMEEFMTLIRVYLQAAIAAEPKLGITINMLPDLKVFKNTLKIPTIGRLGTNEKAQARKLMNSQYGLNDEFFAEIDKAIRKNCHKQQDIQSFFFLFSNFSNDFFTVLTTHLQWKLRIPAFFKKLLRSVIAEGVSDIMNKSDWTAADTFQACVRIRKNDQKLGFTSKWMCEYAYPMILIAKGAKTK